MNWRHITKWLLLITSVVFIVYDFFPFFDPARGDTISEVIMYYALRSFAIPFTFGTLCGHFFWPWDGHYPKPGVLLPVGSLFIVLDVVAHVLHVEVLTTAQTFPIICFVPAVFFGHFFWPQQKEDKL